MAKLKRILEKLQSLKKTKNQKKPIDKKYLFYFSCFFLITFLITNIFFSQKINNLLIGLVNFNEKSAIDFLKKIKNKKYFKNQLLYFENIFQKSLKNEVFKEENEINAKIKKLEQILEKNQKARDVLYSLYLLYNETGDKTKAKIYLKQAKEVDPMLK